MAVDVGDRDDALGPARPDRSIALAAPVDVGRKSCSAVSASLHRSLQDARTSRVGGKRRSRHPPNDPGPSYDEFRGSTRAPATIAVRQRPEPPAGKERCQVVDTMEAVTS